MRAFSWFTVLALAGSGLAAHADTLSTFNIQGSSLFYGMGGDTDTIAGSTTIDITTGVVQSISFNAGGLTETGVDAQYGSVVFVGSGDVNFTISGVTLVDFTGDNFNLNGPNDLYVGHLLLTGSVDPVVSDPETTVAVTPEPSSMLLLGTGLLAFVGLMRRRIA